LYSNCVDMQIQGTNGGTLTGKEPVIINYGTNSHRVGEFSGPNDKDGRELFTSPSRKIHTFRVAATA
ncbi:hypothetical protein DFQ27_008234, partial [Actinomortierella ambigua]